MRVVARTMAGAHNSEAAAPIKMLLRVMRPWSGTRIGVVIQPSSHDEGWHRSAKFAAKATTSHFCGDHLAAEWQVGEGASLRRDAIEI